MRTCTETALTDNELVVLRYFHLSRDNTAGGEDHRREEVVLLFMFNGKIPPDDCKLGTLVK